jgi:hypothetical protein
VSGSNNTVTVTWTDYSDSNAQTISSYKVYRETSSNGAFATSIGSATSKSYTDTTVSNGTTYYYKFAVVDSDGDESDNSPVSSSVTPSNVAGGGAPSGGGGGSTGTTPPATTPASSTPQPTPTPTPTSSAAAPAASPSPLAGMVKPLRVAEGAIFRVDGDSRIYLITHGIKQHIKTAEEFARRGLKWADVQVVSASDAGAVGTTLLVRAKGDSKIYAVSNGVKRWIRNATIFTKSGYSWKNVSEITRAELGSYPATGAFRASGDAKIYLVVGGIRRWVPSLKAFGKLGLKWEEVQEVSAAERDAYPEGKSY